MPSYAYVHGLNSGSSSRSGNELEKVIGAPVYRVQMDYSKNFWECLQSLEEQLRKNIAPQDGQLTLMGTSLGAFYATQLRMPQIGQVIAWNPVIFPALQLARFVGENTRFTDGVKWQFGRAACLSYAAAPDPRQWDNAYLADSLSKQPQEWAEGAPCPRRDIILGIHDEILDYELSDVYWRDHASILHIDSGHHIEHFDNVLTLIE